MSDAGGARSVRWFPNSSARLGCAGREPFTVCGRRGFLDILSRCEAAEVSQSGGRNGGRPLSNRERECLLRASEGMTAERVERRAKLSESAVNDRRGRRRRQTRRAQQAPRRDRRAARAGAAGRLGGEPLPSSRPPGEGPGLGQRLVGGAQEHAHVAALAGVDRDVDAGAEAAAYACWARGTCAARGPPRSSRRLRPASGRRVIAEIAAGEIDQEARRAGRRALRRRRARAARRGRC